MRNVTSPLPWLFSKLSVPIQRRTAHIDMAPLYQRERVQLDDKLDVGEKGHKIWRASPIEIVVMLPL